MKTEDKRKLGKKTRAQGKAFELRVRKDLESKGWIVCKWQNNVEIACEQPHLISAKHTFNPVTKAMSAGNGFPDFVAYKVPTDNPGVDYVLFGDKRIYEVIGVESKMTGKLDKVEKDKCAWLLKKNIFSKILIAQKDLKKIKYVEYQEDEK
jgi:hypothetical protein